MRSLSGLAASLSLATLLLSPTMVEAQVSASPSVMNFQGRLVTPDGNPVPNGTYSIRFSLWNVASGGTVDANEKWHKVIESVVVKNGTFAVTHDTFPDGTFNGNLWLEVKIGSDAALTPRTPLVSVPYAMKSDIALTVPDGSITNDKIAEGSLSFSKVNAADFRQRFWSLGGNSSVGSNFFGTLDNNSLAIRTNNVERMRILANGNVGIGTTTPTANLHIKPFSDASAIIRLDAGTTSSQFAAIDLADRGASLWGFGKNAANDFYIDRSGGGRALTIKRNTLNVGIGITTPKATLHVNGDYYGKGHVFLHAYEGDGNSGTAYVQARDDSGNSSIGMQLRTQQGGVLKDTLSIASDGRGHYRGLFWSDTNFSIGSAGYTYALSVEGDAIADHWATNSDARLKEQIVTVPNALATLMGLHGVTYRWKPNTLQAHRKNSQREYGFLAQEVEQMLPELVIEGQRGYKAVNYQGIIPVTVEAIKAQQSQIAALMDRSVIQQKENEALKAKNAELEAKLTQLAAAVAQLQAQRK